MPDSLEQVGFIHASGAEHAAAELRARSESAEFEAESNSFIEATLMKALFPQDAVRRNFLRAVGRNTAKAGGMLPRCIAACCHTGCAPRAAPGARHRCWRTCR